MRNVELLRILRNEAWRVRPLLFDGEQVQLIHELLTNFRPYVSVPDLTARLKVALIPRPTHIESYQILRNEFKRVWRLIGQSQP